MTLGFKGTRRVIKKGDFLRCGLGLMNEWFPIDSAKQFRVCVFNMRPDNEHGKKRMINSFLMLHVTESSGHNDKINLGRVVWID